MGTLTDIRHIHLYEKVTFELVCDHHYHWRFCNEEYKLQWTKQNPISFGNLECVTLYCVLLQTKNFHMEMMGVIMC